MKKKYFITYTVPKEMADGNDFFLDAMDFFNNWGWQAINVREKGFLQAYIYEIILLFKLPAKATIISTWPGYPRLILKDKLGFNFFRFVLFLLFKKIKKWEYYILVIDMPVIRGKNRFSSWLYKKLVSEEHFLFYHISGILSCGNVMYDSYKEEYPKIRHHKMDMYDQILEKENSSHSIQLDSNKTNIVTIGNLKRMISNINQYPESNDIRYYFCGPGGDELNKLKRNDIQYLGILPKKQLLGTLMQFDYGLINYGAETSGYFSQVIAGKFTTYLMAGIPILCPAEYTSMALLVKEKQCGTVISKLEEISNIYDKKSTRYIKFKENCLDEYEKIRRGFHYKQAIIELGIDK